MPVVVFVLAAAVFAQGTSEFMLSGLLAEIAADCGVSIGSAGLLTSMFAAGMVIGAPAMAVAVSAVPRRTALIGFLGLFCASHAMGALTMDFALLLSTRAVAAIANAGFLAVALASVPALVTSDAVGRATSILLSGVTIACIVGVPAGTVLGQALGWQSAFWAIAIITAVALAALWAMTGTTLETPHQNGIGPVRREWRVLGGRGLIVTVVLGVLVNASTFAGFTYLGTIAAALTGPASPWIPIALALFGIGSFIGVTLAGRHDGRYRTVGTVALAGIWLAAVPSVHTLTGLLVFALITGVGAFGIGATLIATIVRTAAPAAPRIAGAIATTTFNIGAVVGPAAAGLVVGSGAHYALWVSFVLAGVAALVSLLAG
ncbi:DHA1 family chloramphenicol resistance protein-like MFS transporter [Kibdelosporangium banguiense]|uniref:DHA1 family chloramphenicol resistance protein-like MFS transporter n=1 Tax=Kibdelosporangium banguiense TaxID=1365924 RepID=A0ABS4TTD5_9PSEU|nr:MFS transporter [Kibdelosporangium banguiense]MBP2327662.1 DHA1 family chloramphenicol resistance protein-like MFS transporter [Kibdelosporangium banguiense]